MAAVDVVVLVAAVVACVAAVVACVAAAVLVGQVRRLERGIEALRTEAVPLVHEARQAVDHASAEMARVEAVLEDTESVTATVDSASRLAQRAFASPIVKVMALRAGTVGGLRRLRRPGDEAENGSAKGPASSAVSREKTRSGNSAPPRSTNGSKGSKRR